ncbi:MAG TPA: uroporphyrinogen-III synthase, partial [Propionibacteriaceae bacterium]|nr:uroporphyrinogen-III synthase [Propionibacteriaceae bacterium]
VPIAESLAGCVIVITADRRKREMAAALERRGSSVRLAPALSTIPHLDDVRLVAATRELIAVPPHVVVVTTGIGFRAWVEAADAAGLADDLLETLHGVRLVARGPKARAAIVAAGLETDWVAESETTAELRDFLLADGVAGRRIAVQHHGNGSDGLDEAFELAGASVLSLVVYAWGPPLDASAHHAGIEAAANGECDAVLFTSAPGASAWVESVKCLGRMEPIAELASTGRLLLEAVGPVTAGPLEAAELSCRYPDRWRVGALVRDVVKHFTDPAGLVRTQAGALSVRATAAVLDGAVLPLTPSGLAILRALAAARGSVVTREQLSAVMPSGQGGAHAVDAAMSRLRDVAGRDLVKTVVKRGYALAVTR